MQETTYSPYTLPRITRQLQTRKFESVLQPGAILEIKLHKVDGLDSARMAERWADTEAMYISGEHELCVDGKPLVVPGFEADDSSRLTVSLLQNAAAIEAMQGANPTWTLEALLLIAARDEAMWTNIQSFAFEVNQGKVATPSPLATDSSEGSLSPELATQS